MPNNPVIEIQPHDDVLLVVVQKRSLDEASTRALVEEVLFATTKRLTVPVVLDMGRVKFAPSVALGSLVQLHRDLLLDGRRIALIHLDRRVREVLRVTQLDKFLEIHSSVERVLAAPPKRS